MDKLLLRQIPKTDVLLAGAVLTEARSRFPISWIKGSVQLYLNELRTAVLQGECSALPSIEEMQLQVLQHLEREDGFSLRQVINATGVVLHTNLGRAPLGEKLANHIGKIAAGYCNLEYDLSAGQRGSRYVHVEQLLCRLTGAEAAMVVNNNAGAVFLMLNTLAQGKSVAISRGELVEIGGSFRVPEIMDRSGAKLVEVGTTNKTHLDDYRRAAEDQDASIFLKVHTSNFAMTGFTESVSVQELAALGHPSGRLVLYDLGAGFLFPGEALGLQSGVSIARSLKDGADVVCFSGDKLLGATQCGILVGKKELIERIRKNQLTRMLRIDKLSLAGLEMALRCSLDPKLAKAWLPAIGMLSMSPSQCRNRASALEQMLRTQVSFLKTQVVESLDKAGGGSLPDTSLPGYAVELSCPDFTAIELEQYLRRWHTPIISRINNEQVQICVRTLFDGDNREIVQALANLGRVLRKG